ncbi:MAG: hypothetical protein IKW04_00380 [Clostridia bacterium]|nr:hypothetical protein [Clostridia bacterium]
MKMTKEQLFEAALALNGDDKKYQITVEGDTIVTRVKWMDATFFSPDAITTEMQEFEYRVRIVSNGKYTELDKSVSKKKSAGRGGVDMNKSVFVGKQVSFSKTIGVGKDHQTGETGIISNTFYSEEYKAPVRNLLKEFGYKKKMSTMGKILLIGGIVAAVIAAVVIVLFCLFGNKHPVSVENFESIAKDYGYQVAVDRNLESRYDHVQSVRIALDSPDDYQIDLYVLINEDYAKQVFETNKIQLQQLADSSSSKVSSSVSVFNYDKYAASTSDSYLYVARIDNTVVFAKTGIEDQSEVEAFINAIGY